MDHSLLFQTLHWSQLMMSCAKQYAYTHHNHAETPLTTYAVSLIRNVLVHRDNHMCDIGHVMPISL